MKTPNMESRRKAQQKWYKAHYNEYKEIHKDLIKKWSKIGNDKLKRETIQHYGGKCACCGEITKEFLSLDHINGNAKEDNKKAFPTRKSPTRQCGIPFYRWLRKQGFPEGYQILCYNCNCAKGFFGECPHKLN